MDWTRALDFAISFVSGGLGGAILTNLSNKYKNRVQRMYCYYLEDEVQSKIVVDVDGRPYDNMYRKKFKIKNTTNKDFKSFSIRFVFDAQSKIVDYSSHTKAGECRTIITEQGPCLAPKAKKISTFILACLDSQVVIFRRKICW